MADDTQSRREALRLVHHHPGRLRLRAHAFEGAAGIERVARVRERLDAVPGIAAVEHSATTGSLLVAYEAGMIEPDVLVGHVAEAADLDLPRDEPRNPDRPAVIAIDAVREIDAAVVELTGARASLKSLVPAALAALGVYSWFEHPDTRLPRWDNLIYWSYNIFIGLHRREIDEAAERAGEKPEHVTAEGDAGP